HTNQHEKNKEQVKYHFTDEIQQTPRPFKKSGNKSPKGSHVFSQLKVTPVSGAIDVVIVMTQPALVSRNCGLGCNKIHYRVNFVNKYHDRS
ncbi:hypothetical protein AAIH16_42215, partial [Pseudomonas aeruginosa]